MDETEDSTRTTTVISPSTRIYGNPSVILQQPGLSTISPTTRLAAGYAQPRGVPMQQMPMGTSYAQMLGPTDGVIVKQLTNPIEMVLAIEVSNKYQLLTPNGQLIGMAFEQAGILSQNMLRPQTRAFEMIITDPAQREVMRMTRPQTYECCGKIENSEVSVVAYPGEYAGRVVFTGNTCCGGDLSFNVLDHNQMLVFRVASPDSGICTCGSQTFHVTTTNGQQVGEITKTFSGLLREMFTDSDTFRIAYPRDLDPRIKSVLLGATFLIDFMFFEENAHAEANKNNHGHVGGGYHSNGNGAGGFVQF